MLRSSKPVLVHVPTVSAGAGRIGAVATGALAVGALAVGAFAIGRLAIGRADVGRLRIARLEVRELVLDGVPVRAGTALSANGAAQPAGLTAGQV
jgi:hypothetical protein